MLIVTSTVPTVPEGHKHRVATPENRRKLPQRPRRTPQRPRRTLERPRRALSDPEGPARQIDVSRQKLSPHCLEAIFDSQLPSPKLSPKMPPKLSLPHKRGLFILFQNYPRGEANCETSERQKLSRGNFCPATSICLFWPTGEANFRRAL